VGRVFNFTPMKKTASLPLAVSFIHRYGRTTFTTGALVTAHLITTFSAEEPLFSLENKAARAAEVLIILFIIVGGPCLRLHIICPYIILFLLVSELNELVFMYVREDGVEVLEEAGASDRNGRGHFERIEERSTTSFW
jgi:hypothetical protein